MSPEDDLLAAELAIGLLDPDEADAARQRLASEPALASAKAAWDAIVAQALATPDESHDPMVWSAIVRRLPANDVSAPTRTAPSAHGWKIATGIAAAAALVSGLFALQRAPVAPAPLPVAPVAVPPTAAAPVVAVLTGERGAGIVTIAYDPISRRITTVADRLRLGSHSAQLWVLPVAQQPRSVALIAADRPGWEPVAPAAVDALKSGAAVAISLEPDGGSPTGQPTGPIILKGQFVSAS